LWLSFVRVWTDALTILLTYDSAPQLEIGPSPCTACKSGQIWLHSLTSGVDGVAVFQNFFAGDRGRKGEILKSYCSEDMPSTDG